MKDYLLITNTPEDIRASVVSSMLGANARAQYLSRRSNAEIMGGTTFKHTMQFFEETLMDLFVPRAQRSDDIYNYFHGAWAPEQNKSWTPQTHVTEYLGAYTKIQNHGINLPDVVKVQVCLVYLPATVYRQVRLTDSNDFQSHWPTFVDTLTRREPLFMSSYLAWLGSGKPAGEFLGETAVEPPRKKGKVLVEKSIGKAYGKPAADKGPSGSQAPKEGMGKRCGICHQADHLIKECPFVDTNLNNRRVDKVNEGLLAKVRADPTPFITQGKPNQLFRQAGGREVKATSGSGNK